MPPMLKAQQPYISPPHVIPGTGTVLIKLQSSNKSSKTSNGGNALLLKGQVYPLEFSVVAPAMQPAPPIPDPVSKKTGTAQFISMNMTAKAG